ncbi:MAG: hypothetical protein AABO41_06105 [Acidobacteriota bacterium]
MKTLNTHWKLIALGTFAVIVTIWAGSRMEAKTGQDYPGKSGVSPQIREAADEVGVVVIAGITHGQTLRFDLFHSAEAECPGQDQMRLTLFDSQGHVLAQTVIPTGPNQTSHFDVNGDQLAQTVFDNNGRAELTGVLGHLNSGGIPGGGCVVAGEVFDNNTGNTIAHIAGVSLLRCRRGD